MPRKHRPIGEEGRAAIFFKKHYEEIAKAFALSQNELSVDLGESSIVTSEAFAILENLFKRDNPLFDAKLFEDVFWTEKRRGKEAKNGRVP